MPRKKKNSPFVTLSQEALKYCFKEGYKIYPVTSDNVNYQVEISKAHQRALLTEVYTSNTIHQAIADTYDRIYSKRKGN